MKFYEYNIPKLEEIELHFVNEVKIPFIIKDKNEKRIDDEWKRRYEDTIKRKGFRGWEHSIENKKIIVSYGWDVKEITILANNEFESRIADPELLGQFIGEWYLLLAQSIEETNNYIREYVECYKEKFKEGLEKATKREE